jgi:hypothetical protein
VIPTITPPLFEAATGLRKVSQFWFLSRDGDPLANALFARHYSRRHYADGRKQTLFVGPGEKMVLVDGGVTALMIWRKFLDGVQPPQDGVSCACFRNESSVLSSVLIRQAMNVAWMRWPAARFYTIINQKRIRSKNPGCCFKAAGWNHVANTKAGLHILAYDQ